MVTQEAGFLQNRAYQAVSLTHFFIDVLNNSRTLLVAIIAVNLGLSNAQVGIALLLYNVGSALSQPFFGLWADRSGPRWLVVGGMAWTTILYFIAAVSGEWLALILITLAGLGSGAFHPAGTKVASETSHFARTQATGVFFAAGQMGLFLGPIAAGLLLDNFGRFGYLILPLLALSALISGWRWVENPERATETPSRTRLEGSGIDYTPGQTQAWRTSIPLVLIILFTSTIGIATMNFAPKLFAETGYSAGYVGATAGLYMLGSAVGGILGGRIGDQIGRRPAIVIGMVGSILPLFVYIPAGDMWRLVLLLLGGFFAGMPHSVLVISAQSLLPGRRALASGLTLGLMFFSGAIGSYLVGIIADEIGLAPTLQGLAILPLFATVVALFLPPLRKNRQANRG